MSVLVMLNNWSHDFAVALLVSNLLLVQLYGRKLDLGRDQLAIVHRIAWRVTVGALVWLAVAGAIRTATYRSYEWAEAAGKGQVTALTIKHALLGGLVVWGLWMQWRLAHSARAGAR